MSHQETMFAFHLLVVFVFDFCFSENDYLYDAST